MKFLERHFPLPGWIYKAVRARGLTPHILAVRSEVRAAQESARLTEAQPVEPESIPESALLQIRLFREEEVRFEPIETDLESIPLAENEVLFVPQSVIVNKYILFYNSVYLQTDLGTFLDPHGSLNSRFYKTIPAWGISTAYRSNHPGIEEGSAFHGFFPLGPYSVRSIGDVDRSEGTASQNPPGFRGPLEWLRLVRADGHPEFVADLFEYFKIGITYARALQDLDFYGAEQLVFSSASSTSAQVIAMCVNELRPDFTVIGLTSPRNFEMVKALPYFDAAHTYDDLVSSVGAKPSLYFDALGNESVSIACLEHFDVRRWWIYAQGGQKSFPTLLRLNRRGSEYSNGIDSLLYANRKGISDTEILDQAEAISRKHDLETRWGRGYRTISSPRELYALYNAFVHNTHPPGERVRYVSPLSKRA